MSNSLRAEAVGAGAYPFDPSQESFVGGVEGGRVANRKTVAMVQLTAAEAATADTDGVHAAVTDDGTQQTITTAITDPPYPRNITATAGGTAGDIKAISVTVYGLNDLGEEISEVLPAFTVDTAGTVQGNKCFAEVTEIIIPAHDGNGATTAIGFGDKCQLPHLLEKNTVFMAHLDNVKEGTLPTVVVDTDEYEKNTFDLNSALNGTVVEVYYIV